MSSSFIYSSDEQVKESVGSSALNIFLLGGWSTTAIVTCYRILHVVRTASDDSCGGGGLGTRIAYSIDQKSGVLPCHYREFNDTALQTQQCDRNTRWNNL